MGCDGSDAGRDGCDAGCDGCDAGCDVGDACPASIEVIWNSVTVTSRISATRRWIPAPNARASRVRAGDCEGEVDGDDDEGGDDDGERAESAPAAVVRFT